jgi:hypothetical protein
LRVAGGFLANAPIDQCKADCSTLILPLRTASSFPLPFRAFNKENHDSIPAPITCAWPKAPVQAADAKPTQTQTLPTTTNALLRRLESHIHINIQQSIRHLSFASRPSIAV